MTHAIILSELHSSIKPDTSYAKTNDIVTVITNYGGVLIVQLGITRFPVKTSKTAPISINDIPVFHRLIKECAAYEDAYRKTKKAETLIKISAISEKIALFYIKNDTEYIK